MFEKLFTLVEAPAHVQFVTQATVEPSSDVRCEHWLPDVAADSPQRLSSKEYGPAATESHCPQYTLVSTVSRESRTGVPRAERANGRREARMEIASILSSWKACTDEFLQLSD